MKTFITLIILFVSIASAYSQNVVLSQDVSKDTIVPRKGPNRKSFIHTYVGYGLIFGDEAGLRTKLPGTYDFRAGFRYKRRLSQTFAVGYDIAYVKNVFSLDPFIYDKEKYIINKAEGGLYVRLNYGKRGDRVGNFVDIGGSGGWVFKSTYLTVENSNGRFPAKKLVSKYTGVNFTTDYSYSALMRVGFGRYVLYGEYRISDVFTDAAIINDMPRITAGLQIGLHK